MSRIPFFPLISIGFAVSLVASGCSLDPTEPVQADSVPEAPTESSAGPAQVPQERDPMMERGARFMTVVNEHKKRLEENPKDKEALYFLGNANFDINRFIKAREYYQQYLELDPEHPGVRTDLATSYYRTQDVNSALRELNTVLAKKPDHPAALFNLGFILDAEGRDRKKAVEVWETLISKHPDYERADEVRLRIEEIKKSS
ncbi:MAG TPA: tetratricopeptide repeat protein [Nitrospiria bacterium]|nr:tetratricopeptide repeat protein [Nitrospiria bacterium]